MSVLPILEHYICSPCLNKVPGQGIGILLKRDSTNNLETTMLLRNVVSVILGASSFGIINSKMEDLVCCNINKQS